MQSEVRGNRAMEGLVNGTKGGVNVQGVNESVAGPLTQTNEGVDPNVAIGAATRSMSEAEPMTDCAEPFVDSQVTG